MRNFKLSTFFGLMVSLCLVVYSCSKENVNSKKNELTSQIENRTVSELISGINFPINTNFTTTGNTVHWELPSGYTAIGVNGTGQYFRRTAGTVTCTCNKETGGCSPATASGEVACVMTSCSDCTKKESLVGITDELAKIIIINDIGLKFVTKFDQIIGKKLFSWEFKDLPEFNEVFEEITRMQLLSDNPVDTKTIFVDILGIIFTCEVPTDIDNSSLSLYRSAEDDGKVSCSCLSPSSATCPLNNKFIAKYCDASNCQSCKMSGTKVVDTEGQVQKIEIDENGFIR